MADLTERPNERTAAERGQLILVAAVVLAISFVGIAIIVNSAIFTENVATRGDVPGSERALDHRYETVQNLESLVTTVNRQHTADPTTAAQTALAALARDEGLVQASSGGVTDIEFNDTTDGTRIAQDAGTRNFTDTNANFDWTVADGVERVRGVQINVTDPGTLSDISGAYTFQLNGSADNIWSVSVAEAGPGEVGVEVDTPSEQARCTRDVGTAPFEINLVEGTVAGEPCPALDRLSDGTEMWLGTGITVPFAIEFENAAAIEGNYSMVIDDGGTPSGNLTAGPSDIEPYQTDAIYSLSADYGYYTDGVSYETVLRAAPGESQPLAGDP
jgi:hypothetical protein